MILFVDSKVLKLADLNEEFDQGALCRIDPLPPCPRSIRHKTVFVEGLPKDATVQWLEALVKALSESTPSFITIPRHKKGNSCGYAFLEFESSKAAQKVHADFNSKRAMSTAFLLTSNRRKLFQEKMRQKHSGILDDEIIIPPPCLRYLPEAERLRRKPRTPLINSQDNESLVPESTSISEAIDKTHPDSIEMDQSPKKILRLEASKITELPTPRKSRKRRRSSNSKDVIGDEAQPVKGFKIDPDSIDEQKENPKETPHEVKVKNPAPPISLFLRARRNSFPPLHGCYAHHGLTFWQGY
ncbi:unnamed protein product [Oikopleura dioica]|uniref:RRM domain-containing protein n=1 Tax=Oikopleura dioica TaxID=34765 RepID=E4WS97_OIKDI|nr:unnamed protein product [Oikopleura dioica]